MTINHDYEITLQRLMQLEWNRNTAVRVNTLNSVTLLMQEYLRRTLPWAEALDVRWPYGSIPFGFDYNIDLPEDDKARFLQKPFPEGHMKMLARSILVWPLINNDDRLRQFQQVHHLPDNPYAPLLLMYERGGMFRRIVSQIEVATMFNGPNILSTRPDLYRDVPPFVELDAAILDEIDLAATSGQ